MRRGIFISHLLVLLALSTCVAAQDLPRKIRGYSVFKANIKIKQKNDSAMGDSDALISLGDPLLKDLSPTGATLEVSAMFKALEQSGKVDFLAFNDLKVNGIAVEVDEYREPFDFKKGEFVTLPKPATIFVPTTQLLRAALREIDGPAKEWTITGRVFVFGKFRKFGFDHKRVVPIDINLNIPNPLARPAKTGT